MSSDTSNSGIVQKADQIAFHFYTKLFYTVNQARATEEAHSQGKIDKWFNLETPDSDLFTKDAREPYRNISLSPPPGPPPLEIQVLLCIPELTNNQVLIHRSDDSCTINPSPQQQPTAGGSPRPARSTSAQLRIEPTPRYIVLETWTLTFIPHGSSSRLGDQALPTIYKHGIPLFRSLYSLLRVLPVWKLHRRLKRRTGVSRNGNLGISLRVKPSEGRDETLGILDFDTPPSPSLPPLPTQTHTFSPLPHPLGSLTLTATYLSSPNFELDELESHLSSRFISLDLQGFVPTLSKHAVREEREDAISGSGSGVVGGTRSPPRAILGATGAGRGGHGHGHGLGLGLGVGTGLSLPSPAGFGESTSSISSMGRPVTTTTNDNASVAERFIIPSRVPSLGLGVASSSPSSALIPPPRPQYSPFLPPLPFPTATSSSSDPSSAVSGLALHRIRRASSNSPSSIAAAAHSHGVGGGASSSSISPHRVSHSPHLYLNPYQSSSLSSSPISGIGIGARTGISVNPFKGNTLTSASPSASGSSPSLSIRQGISSAVTGGAFAYGATPSSLGDRKGIGSGEHDSGRVSSESERGGWDRDRDDSSRERDRHRRASSGYSIALGSGTIERQEDGTGVPTRIPPTRKRYSSIFGNRYGVGSGGDSGGSTPASVAVGAEGSVAGGVASFLSTATDDDDISMFVQDIDARKLLSGRVKEREKRERDRERQVERGREEGQDHDREMGIEGKGIDFVTSPISRQRQRSPLSPLSARATLDREGGQRERVASPSTTGTGTTLAATKELTAASASGSSALAVPATIPTVQAPLLSVSPPAPANLSTSPNRGPMLTNQDEVDESLKRMNERFMKSLEGMERGGGTVGRRRDREKGKETERRTLSLLVTPGEIPSASPPTSGGHSTHIRTTISSPPRSTQIGESQRQPQHPNPIPVPSVSPIQPVASSSSPSSSTGSSSGQQRALHPQTGLGLWLGRGRGFVGGSSTSPSTSASASSEAIGGASVSQGSEGVIGRMDFYDESSGSGLHERRRPGRF